MSSSWEDIARDAEFEYFKAKETLEECWDEIDRLEQINANQQHEIALLKEQLAASVPQEIRAMPSVSSTTASTSGSLYSHSLAITPSGANYFRLQSSDELLSTQTNEAPKSTCDLFVSNLERLTKESSIIAQNANMPIEHLQTELKESKGTVERLESELEEVKMSTRVQLEGQQRESEKLEEQNYYLEEKIMSLQLQLASYLLNEATNANNSRRHRNQHLLEAPVDDCSVARSDLDCNSESSTMSKGSQSPKPRRSFTISLPSILQRDSTETEKELLRQLEFVQEEKHMDVMELENKLQDRDAIIMRCKRTIAMQEESIQNLQK